MRELVAKIRENPVLFTFKPQKIINPKCELHSTKVYKFTIKAPLSDSLDMDYKQSLKNLNHLKEFIRAWDECYIFFFFNSETTYNIKIYDIALTPEQKKKIDQERRNSFPYGYISCEKSGEEILYYRDTNITIEFDLFLENFNVFSFHDPVDNKLVHQQFLLLIELLKNK